MNKISCIVPVYNEKKRIGTVLSVIQECHLISEVVVVDDCSTDNSFDIISKYKNITLIKHNFNKGKSTAIHTGIINSTGDILLLIDADLIGLSVEAIENLARPILENKADMTISLRKNTPIFWNWIGLDYISGERCFYKKQVEVDLHKLPSLDGFELEVFLNNLVIKNKLKLWIVDWPNVSSPLKRKKFGISIDFICMGLKILSYITLWQVIKQIYFMHKQIVNKN